MKKVILSLILLIIFSNITGCANLNAKNSERTDGIQWDFDHRVQFVQTQLENNKYQLKVIPNSRVGFGQLAKFLLRKAYSLCGSYHYKIEMLQGIQGVDDKKFMPNYIAPSLMANVECKAKLHIKKN